MSPAPARAPRQAAPGFGAALRGWRRHRGLSQLDLALAAEVSPRHVSFLETGRSSPSQEMVLRLLETLEVPLWDRNRLLLAAGYAPLYGESSFDDEGLARVRGVVRQLLDRHEPYPAYAMDGAWNVVEANRPWEAVVAALDAPPAETGNVLRLLCAPHLLRPQIVNWEEVAGLVLRRVRRRLDAPAPPPALAAVVDEIRALPGVERLLGGARAPRRDAPFVPIETRAGEATLRWMTTLLTISGPLDVAVDELAIECFFPADAETERLARPSP